MENKYQSQFRSGFAQVIYPFLVKRYSRSEEEHEQVEKTLASLPRSSQVKSSQSNHRRKITRCLKLSHPHPSTHPPSSSGVVHGIHHEQDRKSPAAEHEVVRPSWQRVERRSCRSSRCSWRGPRQSRISRHSAGRSAPQLGGLCGPRLLRGSRRCLH